MGLLIGSCAILFLKPSDWPRYRASESLRMHPEDNRGIPPGAGELHY